MKRNSINIPIPSLDALTLALEGLALSNWVLARRVVYHAAVLPLPLPLPLHLPLLLHLRLPYPFPYTPTPTLPNTSDPLGGAGGACDGRVMSEAAVEAYMASQPCYKGD